jgi:DNA-binding transcriptional LysR family regulator
LESMFLESLVSVIKNGSIAAGARQQKISPAAMALRLKALETEFGTLLVHRSGRTVVPTEAGARIYARAQSLLHDIDDLRSMAVSGDMVGQMRLGVIASVASGLLAPTLKLFSDRHPNSRIVIQRGVSSALYQSVRRDELDAAIIVEPEFGIPKSCAWTRLNVEPLILITPRSLRVNDPHAVLAREPLIMYDRIHWGGGIAEAYLRHVGIEAREHYDLDSLDSIAALVAYGLGVALVPDWAGRWHLAQPVAKHALPVTGFVRRIGLLWSKSTVRARQVQALVTCAGEALAMLADDSRPKKPKINSAGRSRRK